MDEPIEYSCSNPACDAPMEPGAPRCEACDAEFKRLLVKLQDTCRRLKMAKEFADRAMLDHPDWTIEQIDTAANKHAGLGEFQPS